MLEAMLAQVQNGAAANQMYEDIHEDEDDEDYDDDDDEEDEEDYYPSAGGDQHSIGMFQNPFGSGGAGGGGAGGAGEEEGMQGLLQGLLNMSGAAGLAEMGGGMANMVSGMMGGSPMDGGGAGPGGFDTSMIPGILGTLGAAAANGIVDGFNGSAGGNGATLREYDEDDDDDEEITEASESDDEDEEESDEDDEEHHHSSSRMAAMAAMGGMGAGAGAAAMAAMMNQSHLQQHPSQQMHMYEQHNGRPMMQQGSPYMMNASAAHQAMFSPTTSTTTAPLSLPSGISQPAPSSASSSMPGFAAVAVASAAAAAAAAMSLPSSSPAPVASVAASAVPSSAVISPPVATISSGMGGGTMSRVDPLAALVAGGTATAMGGMVMGKMVSTLSNNSGGGTALVKTEHVYAATPGYATLPPSSMHKSLDELNKLGDSMTMARMSSMPMQSPHSQAMHAALSHQHLAQIHHPGQPNMMYPKQFMPHHMMLRPPVSRSSQMMPHHGAVMPDAPGANGNRNDGDKTSLDRESVPCSETSGGGKSDTESTTKKTPSPTMVGPGRVSPDSSSESSSSGSSDRGHVKNATSMGSLSDRQSATESMRDSDTDNQMERHQMQMRRRLHAMEHDPLVAGSAVMSGAVPLLIETPNYGWSSLVGHENAKDALKNLFLGKKFPEVFDSQGSCRGVLLFGPSGAGKTSLARSLACEAGGAKLIACTPSLISNRNFHPQAAATLVRQMFDHARVYKPCVMLMDEIERLALPELSEAEKAAKAELMAQVRGETTIQPAYPPNANPKSINDHVMLVATTCSPWMLPEELRRLFAYNIHIKLPGEKQREELFRMFLNNYANNVTADHYKCLLSKSEGYSAADINTVVRQAASYNPQTQPAGPNQLHQNHPRVVTYDDLASAMTNYRCSCKPEDLTYYMKYIQEATHRTEDIREDEDKKKPKGVKKIGRLAKSFAAAVISVID